MATFVLVATEAFTNSRVESGGRRTTTCKIDIRTPEWNIHRHQNPGISGVWLVTSLGGVRGSLAKNRTDKVRDFTGRGTERELKGSKVTDS